MAVKSNYKNDVLDTSQNTNRKFNLVDAQGNVIYTGVSLVETTAYTRVGDTFAAEDANAFGSEINNKQDKTDADILIADHTVVGAINALNKEKQNAQDVNLTTTDKTVIGAINELQSGKQNKTDNSLTTASKTVVGAINEINATLTNKASAPIVTNQYTGSGRASVAVVNRIGDHLAHVSLQVSYTVNIPTDTAFATIPNGFRPKANVSAPAVIKLSDGQCYLYDALISTNGNISQPFSNTAREFLIDTIYEI